MRFRAEGPGWDLQLRGLLDFGLYVREHGRERGEEEEKEEKEEKEEDEGDSCSRLAWDSVPAAHFPLYLPRRHKDAFRQERVKSHTRRILWAVHFGAQLPDVRLDLRPRRG